MADAGLGLALRVGYLPVIRTPWVVSSVAPTLSTAPQKKLIAARQTLEGSLPL